MTDLRSENAQLVDDAARALVGGLAMTAGEDWQEVKPDFLAVLGDQDQLLEAARRRLARVDPARRHEVVTAEVQAWRVRLGDRLDANPELTGQLQRLSSRFGAGTRIGTVVNHGGNVGISGPGSTHINTIVKGDKVKRKFTFFVPILPIFQAHPVIATVTTVVVLGGAVAGGVAAIDSGSGGTATVVMGTLDRLDLTARPPVVNRANGDLQFIFGQLFGDGIAQWTAGGEPAAEDCIVELREKFSSGTRDLQKGQRYCTSGRDGSMWLLHINAVVPQRVEMSATHLGTS